MSEALTPTLMIGDTHADLDLYFRAIADAERQHGRLPSIMVGDFGFGYLSSREAGTVERFHRANPRHRVLRGNHDDPAIIKDAPGNLADGTILGSVLFLGGADGGLSGRRTEMTDAEMVQIRQRLEGLAQPPASSSATTHRRRSPRRCPSHAGCRLTRQRRVGRGHLYRRCLPRSRPKAPA